jgi:hypothetical protein
VTERHPRGRAPRSREDPAGVLEAVSRVADPPLGAVDDVLIAVAARGCVERHSIRAVRRFGQRKGADGINRGEAGQPALALLL